MLAYPCPVANIQNLIISVHVHLRCGPPYVSHQHTSVAMPNSACSPSLEAAAPHEAIDALNSKVYSVHSPSSDGVQETF